MEKLKIGITTDCVCDLPQKILDEYRIDTIPFHIITERGRFCDFLEITSDNVLEYIGEGHKAMSVPPSPEEYRSFFKEELEKYETVIHLTITQGMSLAYKNAGDVIGEFDGHVIVIDSMHLSTGLGQLAMKASQLASEGKTAEYITEYITEMRERVSTSFISYSADYLYYNGKIKKSVASICGFLGIHPILSLNKSGHMVLGGVQFGNYERAAKRYIAGKLKHSDDINRGCMFITHAGCGTRMLSVVKNEVDKYNRTDKIEITSASATVSSNCGPNAFGVLFYREKKQ